MTHHETRPFWLEVGLGAFYLALSLAVIIVGLGVIQ